MVEEARVRMKFQLLDKVVVNDRKMKTHSFSGLIIGIDKTIENTPIYMVQIQMENIEGKKLNKQIANLLENQLTREIESV